MTDMDDTNCVSLAPRRHPRVCSVHLPPLAPLAARRSEAGASATAAPPPSLPPASAVMQRSGSGADAHALHARDDTHPVLRMRRNGSASHLATEGKRDTGGEGVRAAAGSTSSGGESSVECLPGTTGTDVRSLCGIQSDADMLWTFLAGMLLYITTV